MQELWNFRLLAQVPIVHEPQQLKNIGVQHVTR